MKALNEFLRKFDLFGVLLTFKYKSKEKYTTILGGIVTLLFIVLALIISILNFIPFYNRKNFTTIYYTLKLAETERIIFDKSKVAFSIGLNCWKAYDGTKAEDLFDVSYIYNYYIVENGTWKKNIDIMTKHPCTHSDFYNDFNKSFDDNQVNNYFCLDDFSRPVEGIFTSPPFAYYEFDVYAKNNSKILLDKIENYLIENDCKLQIYYIDKTIDIDDYENPIKSYLETDFIQLNPTLSTRRNIYFMNQHLYDDDSFISLITDENNEETQLSSIYSRYDEYSLYQGLNRTNISSDYLNWAKVYFRADTRKIDVKRKYQGIMEFYADASSLLIAFYDIIFIIINYINTFYAELSISKKIFFFKELDTDLNPRKSFKKINKFLFQKNKKSKYQNFPKQIRKTLFLDSNSEYSNKIEKNSSNNLSSKNGIKMLNINKFDVMSDSNKRFFDKLKLQKLQIDNIFHQSNIENNNIKSNMKYNNSKKIEKMKPKKINYDYNIFEFIFLPFCKCYLSKNLELKKNYNEKSSNFLRNNLDIVSYVRNQILFNIINEIILDEKTKSIVNFLCHPVISKNKEPKDNFFDIYRIYEEKDFNKFSQELLDLIQKPNKSVREKKLIRLSNNHLNYIFNNS